MATITTRAGKGSPLTNNEVDANFTNLNTDKAETDGATLTNVDINSGSIDGTVIGGASAAAGTFTTLNTSGAVVFNEAGADVDFRVESDTNTHMLFVDAGSNHVNIGTATDLGEILNVNGGVALGNDPTISWGSNTLTLESRNAIGVLALSGVSSGDNPRMDFLNSSGSMVHRISTDGGVIFNETGADQDFRVESDTSTHMLFVDAGTNRVGIGAGSNPRATLDVYSADVSASFDINDTTTWRVAQFRNNIDSVTDSAAGIQLGNDPANDTKGAAIVALNKNSTGGIVDLVLYSSDGNLMKNRLHLYASTEAVFNEDSIDYDFRVESDTNTHALFVDAGNGRVGILNSSPATALDVAGTVTADGADLDGAVVINESGADVDFRVESDTNTHALFVDAGNSRVGIGESSPDLLLHVKGGDSGATGNSAGQVFIEGVTEAGISIGSSTAASSYVWFGDSDNIAQGRIRYDNGADKFEFRANNVDDILVLGSSEAVFNEESNDQDFRVESDGNSNMIFVDAGNDQVKIGTSTAASTEASLVVSEMSMFQTTESSAATKQFAKYLGLSDDVAATYITFNLPSLSAFNQSANIGAEISYAITTNRQTSGRGSQTTYGKVYIAIARHWENAGNAPVNVTLVDTDKSLALAKSGGGDPTITWTTNITGGTDPTAKTVEIIVQVNNPLTISIVTAINGLVTVHQQGSGIITIS
jgi:hypothetical protein